MKINADLFHIFVHLVCLIAHRELEWSRVVVVGAVVINVFPDVGSAMSGSTRRKAVVVVVVGTRMFANVSI